MKKIAFIMLFSQERWGQAGVNSELREFLPFGYSLCLWGSCPSSFSFTFMIKPIVIAAFLFIIALPSHAQREEMDLSGSGWHLWQDTAAAWQNEPLFPPGTDLSKIPSNPPTCGWDQLSQQKSTLVTVPGTVEQYLYRRSPDQKEDKHYQGMVGVSWWFRNLSLPDGVEGKVVRLDFESARYRAEVYLNQRLVGYNLVEGTPFSVDLTGLVKSGEKEQLAVRITSPGGWWSWEDCNVQKWGNYTVPLSRGFSGLTGGVKLLVLDPTHVDDVYVQNTSVLHDINVAVTLNNTGQTPVQGLLHLKITPRDSSGVTTLEQDVPNLTLPPGETVQTVKLSVPQAKIWDLEHPNLYRCTASWVVSGRTVDAQEQTFGFRWFAPEDIGKNAVFRLNGKRVVLRTAISWGLWATTGLIPSAEMAEHQIADAKAYGMNMLNFHRCIGQPIVFDKADEMGLLYFEEPGCYVDGSADPFCELLVREKLLRMVRRDRSHPSLIIYNMINEQWTKYAADKKPELYGNFQRDMADAHKIDPSRVIVLTSAWSRKPPGEEEPVKLNMLPFDDQPHLKGWFDFHRASGPECWRQEFYSGPEKHYGYTNNAGEIVYWGEEGAVSSPPRLALIKQEVEGLPNPGWDGEIYLDWYHQFSDYLTRKHLHHVFADVDQFCLALGSVAIEHQGRKIEDTRISNLNDGYAINGWEAEPYENHSGVVDCFRHPKGDPGILAYYNQPLYVAVKTRNEVVTSGTSATVDYYIINEKDVKGPHQLIVSASGPDGTVEFKKEFPVDVVGGETYGQLLTEGVTIPITKDVGLWTLKAKLVDPQGESVATGHDQILVVDWQDAKLGGHGAIYEVGTAVHDFLKTKLNLDVPEYTDHLGSLDWIIIARAVKDEPVTIPHDALRTPDGQQTGLQASFYSGKDFSNRVSQRVDAMVDYSLADGAAPDPAVSAGADYCVRWEGLIVPPRTGNYSFSLSNVRGKALLKINNQEVHDHVIALTAQVPVKVSIDYQPPTGRGNVTLNWIVPVEEQQDPAALMARASRDGTCILVADHASAWMDLIKVATTVSYNGTFNIGGSWLGGQYFAVEHPLFKDLPTNVALNWPYQTVIDSGRSRYGLLMEGEKLVAGCWQSFPMHLGTAVGIIPAGKGRIVVSTLDICPHLNDPPGPADVARKLLCNYLEYAQEK